MNCNSNTLFLSSNICLHKIYAKITKYSWIFVLNMKMAIEPNPQKLNSSLQEMHINIYFGFEYFPWEWDKNGFSMTRGRQYIFHLFLLAHLMKAIYSVAIYI